MRGRIESGQLVTLSPQLDALEVGDAVLCRVRGNTYIHIIKTIQGHGPKQQYLIGNNHGRINGWTTTIYGVVTRVED